MKNFKIVLSWLSLLVCYVLVFFAAEALVRFSVWVIVEINTLSLVVRILIYLLTGTVILGLAFLPISVGAPVTVFVSEAIAPSKRGERYIVFSTALIVLSITSFIIVLMAGTLNIACIYIIIYCIYLLVLGRSTDSAVQPPQINENDNYDRASALPLQTEGAEFGSDDKKPKDYTFAKKIIRYCVIAAVVAIGAWGMGTLVGSTQNPPRPSVTVSIAPTQKQEEYVTETIGNLEIVCPSDNVLLHEGNQLSVAYIAANGISAAIVILYDDIDEYANDILDEVPSDNVLEELSISLWPSITGVSLKSSSTSNFLGVRGIQWEFVGVSEGEPIRCAAKAFVIKDIFHMVFIAVETANADALPDIEAYATGIISIK